MELEIMSDEDIVTAGRRMLLEICFDALPRLAHIIHHGGPGDAPSVSAAGKAFALLGEPPFALIRKADTSDSDVARQVVDAVEKLMDGARLSSDAPAVDEDGSPAATEPH